MSEYSDPLVSVIVPTYNSAHVLERCLQSVQNQSYSAVELIVVDNHSVDTTVDIAKKYASAVYVQGPERSAQRNFGVKQAKGEYVAIIDSDMELETRVIAECVQEIHKENTVGVVIPEKSFGTTFWAECKALERSFYQGVLYMEAGRFFSRTRYVDHGGYDESLVSGEDWDLSDRIGKEGKLGRTTSYILHNEGDLRFWKTVSKKFYYAKKFSAYTKKKKNDNNCQRQMSLFGRYKLFFSDSKKLFANPLQGVGMLCMKTAEFGFGGVGYIYGKIFS